MNSIQAETTAICTPYSTPFTSCPDRTLSDTFPLNHPPLFLSLNIYLQISCPQSLGHLDQMSVEFIQSVTLGSVCLGRRDGAKSAQSAEQDWASVWCGGRVTLGAAGGWCVALDCCMLRSVLVPSLLHLAQCHQNSFFINQSNSYCNTIDIAYHKRDNDDIQRQDYIAINVVEFSPLAVLTQNQMPLRHTSDFPILPHHPPSAPRSLSKSNPTTGFAFA